MMENMGKKIIVCVIVLVFLGLAMSPMINAQITENDFNGTKDMMKKFLGKTVKCGDNSIYDLLIIAPKKFTRNLQPLVDHKEGVDIKTRLVTLDEVYEKMFWHGQDNPEKIKCGFFSAIQA